VFILCNTSSILMLLRIAPDMFINDAYKCKTIREIHDEIARTTKFKTKYPWTQGMRANIKPIILNQEQKKREAHYFDTVRTLNRVGTENLKTGRIFDLSFVDLKLISHALSLDYRISSGDRALVQFVQQEFKDEFRGAISPIEMINGWIEKRLLAWDEVKQGYLSAWAEQNEHPQPVKAKKRFKDLTGYRYTGS